MQKSNAEVAGFCDKFCIIYQGLPELVLVTFQGIDKMSENSL